MQVLESEGGHKVVVFGVARLLEPVSVLVLGRDVLVFRPLQELLNDRGSLLG